MIRDRDRYHGCVHAHLIDRWDESIDFRKLKPNVQGVYIVKDVLPIYIKYSKARCGPWTFTFQVDHLSEYRRLVKEFGQCIVAFVCGADGIAAIDYEQFSRVTAGEPITQAVVVRRRLKEMYSIKGIAGFLDGKVGRESLYETVRTHLVSG